MKALVKCEFYFMILFAALLFTVGTVESDDRTELSTGDTTQMTKKPTIMILGSSHLANPGMDGTNYKMDDVLAPKRQREIEQLVKQLREFKPTKMAFEIDFSRTAEINTTYQDYLKGAYELKRHESDQIGFRLAKQMGHSKVYCVYYFRNYSEEPDGFFPEDFDWDLVSPGKFAKAHNQEHLMGQPPTAEGKVTQDADGRIWIEPEKYEPIIDLYRRLNQPEDIRADHQEYLRMARVGLGDQYPGANWVGHLWYTWNLKIFVNLTRITESADDRILLIIGAGHVFLVQQFLEDSGDYIVASPLQYLEAGATEAP
ncbi:MAG: DUF5694 domain-containing protein [Candidatus Poribacteria bacterium]|nr:DUF5694 domain-containing protein [Candidatus Poribacteria bacterium]